MYRRGFVLGKPTGRNLHIFHLPAEIDDMALTQLFTPFGHISRVKVRGALPKNRTRARVSPHSPGAFRQVMVHRQTNLSKGFGFVEFHRAEDAALALAHMDGYKIGKKHLKVTYKR